MYKLYNFRKKDYWVLAKNVQYRSPVEYMCIFRLFKRTGFTSYERYQQEYARAIVTEIPSTNILSRREVRTGHSSLVVSNCQSRQWVNFKEVLEREERKRWKRYVEDFCCRLLTFVHSQRTAPTSRSDPRRLPANTGVLLYTRARG